MPVTPRRSTRSQAFTPVHTQAASVSLAPVNVTFTWTSAPRTDGDKVSYTSFKRVKRSGGRYPDVEIKSRGRAISTGESSDDDDEEGDSQPGPSRRRADDEARFAIGDGVAVTVEGGNEGIGMLTALWEEPVEADDEDEEKEDEGDKEETRMMGRVHWFFRKEDLPGVMRNLNLDEVRKAFYSDTDAPERGPPCRITKSTSHYRLTSGTTHQDGPNLLRSRVSRAIPRCWKEDQVAGMGIHSRWGVLVFQGV